LKKSCIKQAASSSCSAFSSCLKMEVECSSKISVDFDRRTWHHIPEDRTLHSYPCDNVSHLGKSILKVIDGTGWPSCPVAGFDVSSTDPSVTATRELIIAITIEISLVWDVDIWRDNHFYNLCIDVYCRCAEYTEEPWFEG
jgi:hypothetical protein